MIKVKCHVCSHENEAIGNQRLLCVRCGADMANLQAETKLLEDDPSTAAYTTSEKRSEFRKEAFVYLTNKRLVVIPAETACHGGGLGGALAAKIAGKLAGDQPGVISIPLGNVKNVRDSKFGLFFKALTVDTADGEMIKMTLSDRDEWKNAINKATEKLR